MNQIILIKQPDTQTVGVTIVFFCFFLVNRGGVERLEANDPDTGGITDHPAPGDPMPTNTDTYVWRDTCR